MGDSFNHIGGLSEKFIKSEQHNQDDQQNNQMNQQYTLQHSPGPFRPNQQATLSQSNSQKQQDIVTTKPSCYDGEQIGAWRFMISFYK